MAHVILGGPQGQLVADDRGAGAAPPIVFVHSDLGTRQHWSAAIAHVSAKRRAAALDLRGHGESAAPEDGDLSYEGRAADIGALVDVLSAKQVVLVAHSGGAIAALTYAAEHPSRVAGLVLVDPAGDPGAIPAPQREGLLQQLRGPGYRDVVRGYYTSIAGENADVRERVIADALATPQATVVGTFEALNGFQPRKLLGRYQGPMLVVVTPQTDQEWMLHRIGNLPFRVVESSSHWIHLDKPDELNAILDQFLVAT
jgi:pimeloyl-ACP methyl ester carboxylesterase